MEMALLKQLASHISSFFDLLSRKNITSKLILRHYQEAEQLMKQLNSVIKALGDLEIQFDEGVHKSFEELIHFVDELNEHYEKWRPFSSNVFFVLQSEDLISKIKKRVLFIIQLLQTSNEQFNTAMTLNEQWVEDIESKESERMSTIINDALSCQVEGSRPGSGVLVKMAECLNLRTNQEILIEAVALQKLKENAEQVEHIDQIIGLLMSMHELLIAIKKSRICSSVKIPADLFCPISLELMTDPVIVTSGQTYERSSIKNWIDLGLDVCPKTRQKLVHTNLCPNISVKALIANWCEINNVKLPDSTCTVSLNQILVELSECKPEKKFKASNEIGEEASPSYASPTAGGSPVANSSTDPAMENREGADTIRSGFSSMAEKPNQNISRTGTDLNEISNPNFSPTTSNDADEAFPVSSTLSKYEGNEFEKVKPELPLRLVDGPYRDRPPNRNFVPRIVPQSRTATSNDLYGIESQVKNLVQDLRSTSYDTVRDAAEQLRLLAKVNTESRILIATCGAIGLLVNLLRSPDAKIQENSVTALLNLSINDNNKSIIAEANAIEPLIHVLETGSSEAKENAAATLSSIAVIGDNKIRTGRSGAIGPLIDLLEKGSPRGKKDAATALCHLSLVNENKSKIVLAGGVKHLVHLMDPAYGIVDKAVSVLSNLATIQDGKKEIGRHPGGIPALVEVVELGSARGKESAAAALCHLCSASNRFCWMVLKEGAVPPLVVLSRSGTGRAREKALLLLKYLMALKRGKAGRV